jgi:hypothetical protein
VDCALEAVEAPGLGPFELHGHGAVIVVATVLAFHGISCSGATGPTRRLMGANQPGWLATWSAGDGGVQPDLGAGAAGPQLDEVA